MDLSTRIMVSRRKMAEWKRQNRLNASVRIAILKKELDQALTHGTRSTQEIQEIRNELNQAYREEEHFWKIKSRNNWLKLGDRHTKVFYAAAKQRLARNRIMAIEDDLGMIHRGDENNGVVASDYFVDLFNIRLRFVLTCCLTQVPNVIADLLRVDGLS